MLLLEYCYIPGSFAALTMTPTIETPCTVGTFQGYSVLSKRVGRGGSKYD